MLYSDTTTLKRGRLNTIIIEHSIKKFPHFYSPDISISIDHHFNNHFVMHLEKQIQPIHFML